MLLKRYKNKQTYIATLLLLCAMIFAPTPAVAANIADSGNAVTIFGAGGHFKVNNVKSIKDMRFIRVVRQKYDYSCGSAALATLLTYHYGEPTNEQVALKAMFANGNKEKIRKEGFSMLDMKQYMAGLGLEANGFKTSLDKLIEAKVPAIVLINSRGYMHFVVVKGLTKNKILYGDPALGMKSVDRKSFEKMWNGVVFVVTDADSMKYAAFNAKDDWRGRTAIFAQSALDNRSLASFTVNTAFSPNHY